MRSRRNKEAYLAAIAHSSAGALAIKVCDKVQQARELARLVRRIGDAAYAPFARKEYPSVEGRKAATLWFFRAFCTEAFARLAVLRSEEPQPILDGIEAFLEDLQDIVSD